VANRIEVAQAFVANYSATTAGILGYVGDAAAAQARSFLRTVTDTTASKTTALAGVAAAVAATTNAGAAGVAGTSFTLTTNVETASGTAANDTFAANALTGAVSFNAGDIVNGGSGTDTLRLQANQSLDAVQLNSVEVVDVRMLSAGTITANALDWSGTTTVNITSDSINDATLAVTNARQGTTFKVSDDANITVSYLDETGGSDVARLAVDSGGVSGSAATFTISGTEAVTLGVSGTSFATVSAADSVLRDITISGVGALNFSVSESSISGLSLAQFSGSSDITLGANSSVLLTGGTGADTLRFGTTFNGLDTVNGGAGTDVLLADIGGLVGFNNVSNVETGSFTASSTLVADASGASFTTIDLQIVGAGTDVTINSLGTVELNLTNTGTDSDLAFDYAGTNANIDFEGNGQSFYSALDITDASGVDISIGAASGTQTVSALTIDADGKALILGAGTRDLTVSTVSGAGLTSLVASVGASGHLVNSAAVASALTSVNLTADGASASLVFGALSLNTGSVTVTQSVSGDKANGTLGALAFGGSGVTDVVTLSATGSGATIDAGSVSMGTGVLTITTNANGASAAVDLDAFSVAASGTTTINVNASGAAASGGVDAITGSTSGTTTVNVTLGGDANANIGDVVVGSAGAVLNVNARAVASGDFTFGDLQAGSADSTTATTLAFNFTLGSGDLSIGSGQAYNVSISGVAGAGASGNFATISAQNITSIVFGGSGVLGLGDVHVVSGVGSISITDGVFSAAVQANTVGAISIAGDGAALALSATVSIGNITIGSSNSGNVTISNSLSATFGNITIGGGGVVTVLGGDASGVGTVNTTGKSGQSVLNFASAHEQVLGSLGGGSNDVHISLAGTGATTLNGDFYQLSNGTGADYFRFLTIDNNDAVIQRFQLASGTDRLGFGTAGFDLGQSAEIDSLNVANGFLNATGITGASAAGAANQVFVLQSGTFASLTDLASALSSGRFAITAGANTTAGAEFVVVWADTNGDSHVSMVTTQASAAAAERLFSAVGAANIVDMALLDDVNVATFSGTSYTDKFFAY
jgi:hypothetical protein